VDFGTPKNTVKNSPTFPACSPLRMSGVSQRSYDVWRTFNLGEITFKLDASFRHPYANCKATPSSKA
jgi:hypothetical protein